jgi:hypothetical protein
VASVHLMPARGIIQLDGEGKVVSIEAKPQKVQLNCGAALFFVDADVPQIGAGCSNAPCSKRRGKFEPVGQFRKISPAAKGPQNPT